MPKKNSQVRISKFLVVTETQGGKRGELTIEASSKDEAERLAHEKAGPAVKIMRLTEVFDLNEEG